MDSREQFEKHIRDNYVMALAYGHLSLKRDDDGSYVHGDINGWWIIWQASRATAVVKLPEIMPIVEALNDNERWEHIGANGMRNTCKAAIIAAGIAVS